MLCRIFLIPEILQAICDLMHGSSHIIGNRISLTGRTMSGLLPVWTNIPENLEYDFNRLAQLPPVNSRQPAPRRAQRSEQRLERKLHATVAAAVDVHRYEGVQFLPRGRRWSLFFEHL